VLRLATKKHQIHFSSFLELPLQLHKYKEHVVSMEVWPTTQLYYGLGRLLITYIVSGPGALVFFIVLNGTHINERR
jgi:hypothetical protein